MKRGVDTNVLVQAHIRAMPEHGAVHDFLSRELADPDVILVVTPLVLHEFVHVVTDARRFDEPLSMSEALDVAEGYIGHSNIECAPEDAAALALAFQLLRRYQLGRKRIADALLAACWLNAEVSEIITCNASDFAIVEGLRAIDPRTPAVRR